MGASASNLKRLVNEEYTRLKKDRDYLILDDVLEFQLSLSGWRLDPAHVGVLLAIDRDRDGRFPESELLAFANFVHDRAAEFQQYELQSMVHGRCMLDLWRNINTDQGLDEIVDWCALNMKQQCSSAMRSGCGTVCPGGLRLMKVVRHNHASPPHDPMDGMGESALENRVSGMTGLSGSNLDKWQKERDDRPRTFAPHPQVLYLHKNSLLGIHRILGNHGAHMHSFETFLNTLQRLAEERQLLELSNTALDDWVPEQVLRTYVAQVLNNMRQLVADMDVLQDLLQEPTA